MKIRVLIFIICNKVIYLLSYHKEQNEIEN